MPTLMKTRLPALDRHPPRPWSWAASLAAGLAVCSVSAADTNAPAPLTPQQMFEGGTNSYTNWLDLSVGGFITSGNNAQFQQQHQRSGSAFGGIDDFHFQEDIAKNTTVSVDGRSIFDEHDYHLTLGVVKENTGYVRFSIDQFRTWYNGDGGFFPPTGSYFPLSNNSLGLDRSDIVFEAGLRLENAPAVTFRYEHTSRDGEKSSTDWGFTHPDGSGLVRGLSPSFYSIDEHSDSFQLDVTHHIKATDFGAGLTYETGNLNDTLHITQFPGEGAIQQGIQDNQGTSYDMFNVHAFTETWLKKNLMFSTGYSFSDLDNTFSGSRTFNPSSTQNDFGYFGLHGGSRLYEYVMDVNLLYKPTPHISLVPSIRVDKQDWDADSSASETLGVNPSVPLSSTGGRGEIDVRERMDLTYTAITNWVFYARGDWTEGNATLSEDGGLVPITGIGILPVDAQIDENLLFQKYSLGARWYPTRRISADIGGYYKNNNYDNTFPVDSTPNDPGSPIRYPAYLAMQNFETEDVNARVTVRPRQNISLVSRCEFQYSTIHTTPDLLSGVESSRMTTWMLAQDATWTPWSRLYLQAGVNCVVSDTRTPGLDPVTQAILTARNNYWTVNFSSGFVVDDKTDLKLSYFFYNADDYKDNSLAGVPYGADAEEHGVTATLTRRISKNLRLALRYGFWHYDDASFGGNRNFDAHLVYSSLQYRF
jgi:hypothetical protein